MCERDGPLGTKSKCQFIKLGHSEYHCEARLDYTYIEHNNYTLNLMSLMAGVVLRSAEAPPHIGPELRNSFKEGTSGQLLYGKLTVRHHVYRKYVPPNQTHPVF